MSDLSTISSKAAFIAGADAKSISATGSGRTSSGNCRHLTHGSKVNFSGKWFNVVSYGVRQDNELIDYDQLRDLAIEHKPKMICSGATAYPSLIDFEKVRQICDEVGAIMWVDAAHFIGLVAGKAIPSPVPYADVVSFSFRLIKRYSEVS